MSLNPALISNQVSDLDNTHFFNGSHEDTWRHIKDQPIFKEKVYAPQGSPFPLKPVISKDNNDGPFINGQPTTKKSMFIFSQNQCKPECCPSTYSCSGGCVCTTKNQRDLLASRGMNRRLTDNNEF